MQQEGYPDKKFAGCHRQIVWRRRINAGLLESILGVWEVPEMNLAR